MNLLAEFSINGETNPQACRNGKGPDLRVDRWNGLSTLGFDGQSQYLRVDDSSVFDFGEDATIFVVAKGDTLSDWRPILSKRGKMGSVGNSERQYRLRDFLHRQGHDWKRWSARRNSDQWRGSRLGHEKKLKRTQWADGNEEYDIDDRDPVPPTSSDLIIGARDQNGITAFGGVEIGEILIFDSALSDVEVSQMQGHLAHKWGLTGAMANEHPYKNSPPLFENRPEITLHSTYTYFYQTEEFP